MNEFAGKTFAKRTTTIAAAAGVGGMAIAIAGFLGHLLAVPALYSTIPGLEAMSWLSASAMLILAAGQCAHLALQRRSATILLSISALLGAIAIVSHLLTNNDVVSPALAGLFRQDSATAGRTSLGTAIGIATVSLASHPLLARRPHIRDTLAAVAFFIALMALSCYAYGAADLYALPWFRTMSLNTSVAILLLAGGAVLGRGESGWAAAIAAPGIAGSATRRQLSFLFFPPVLGWLLVRAADAGYLRLASAMAAIVVLTIAPLLWLVLRDGTRLAQLDRERARRYRLERDHLVTLEAQLAEQVGLLEEKSQQRLALAEMSALRSEGRYRLLFDSIDTGFCIVEMRFDDAGHAQDYRFLEVNVAFEATTGLRDAEGQWMRELVPLHEQHWFDNYGRVAKLGAPLRFESPALNLGDRLYDVHAFPIENDGETLVGILFNDVTERKRAEQSLRDLNATLGQRVTDEVAERERAQAALLQSQKMEAMGQLTGGVAHDFNNLLTPIIGSLDLLVRRDVVGDRERRLIEGALQSADRAKVLVQRLLAFARRQPLQNGPVDVATLVRGMAELVKSTSGPQVRVLVEVGDDMPPAHADANQIEMAILNLCVNARDAMPDGGTLTIAARLDTVAGGAHASLAEGDYIRLQVADTGAGMDVETVKRAIEPFFSTKGIGKGTGLGLSMVHGLAAQSGGTLDIQSRPGLGTRVDLWVPVSRAAATTAEKPVDMPLAVKPKARALVVDDEALVRMTTADMLQDLGYETVELASAGEARTLVLGGQTFDLLVTDHLMPVMTGAELARILRIHRPALPILLVSGYADAEGIPGDLPRLTKPFRKDDLGRAIAELTG